MNNAAVSMSEHVFRSPLYVLQSSPQSELVGSYGNYVFHYLKSLSTFPEVAVPLYASTSDAQVSQVLCFLNNTCYFLGYFVYFKQ